MSPPWVDTWSLAPVPSPPKVPKSTAALPLGLPQDWGQLHAPSNDSPYLLWGSPWLFLLRLVCLDCSNKIWPRSGRRLRHQTSPRVLQGRQYDQGASRLGLCRGLSLACSPYWTCLFLTLPVHKEKLSKTATSCSPCSSCSSSSSSFSLSFCFYKDTISLLLGLPFRTGLNKILGGFHIGIYKG